MRAASCSAQEYATAQLTPNHGEHYFACFHPIFLASVKSGMNLFFLVRLCSPWIFGHLHFCRIWLLGAFRFCRDNCFCCARRYLLALTVSFFRVPEVCGFCQSENKALSAQRSFVLAARCFSFRSLFSVFACDAQKCQIILVFAFICLIRVCSAHAFVSAVSSSHCPGSEAVRTRKSTRPHTNPLYLYNT